MLGQPETVMLWSTTEGAVQGRDRVLGTHTAAAGAGGRELGDLVDVGLVDDGRSGDDRLATAEKVAVGQVQPEGIFTAS